MKGFEKISNELLFVKDLLESFGYRDLNVEFNIGFIGSENEKKIEVKIICNKHYEDGK